MCVTVIKLYNSRLGSKVVVNAALRRTIVRRPDLRYGLMGLRAQDVSVNLTISLRTSVWSVAVRSPLPRFSRVARSAQGSDAGFQSQAGLRGRPARHVPLLLHLTPAPDLRRRIQTNESETPISRW